MEVIVVNAGVLPAASAAISIGGTRDAGRDLSDEGREIARRIRRETALALGARVLDAATLERAVELRQEVYAARLASTTPAVYVNVGGNHASLGGARAPFRREEGWLEPAQPEGAPSAGVMAAWMAKGVPALNLLDVKALARAWGLE
jgi:poly-gamma-glutamate system protein